MMISYSIGKPQQVWRDLIFETDRTARLRKRNKAIIARFPGGVHDDFKQGKSRGGCELKTDPSTVSGHYFSNEKGTALPIHGNEEAVVQNITLFSGTIRDNRTLWNPAILEKDMINAAKDACIRDIITRKPGAYDFKLMEDGANFSGGERQRLYLPDCRALPERRAQQQ